MSFATAEPGQWTARRWLYAVVTVFTMETSLLLYVGQREETVAVRPPFRTAVHFVFDPWSSEQLDRLPAMSDPSLFALPGESGFSGEAWLRPAPLLFQPKHWSGEICWLPLDEKALGAGFVQFAATNFIAPPLVVDQPVPPLLRYEPHFPSDPFPPRSRLRLEGELGSRSLVSPLAIRSWTHSDLLSNTVVQAAIDADGHVMLASLLVESGFPSADAEALKLAALARFRALPRAARDATGAGPLAWGRMIFQWHTVSRSATNSSLPRP
ncbi:MAG: hypothetical protein QOF48_3387 [Verrucomicrobiota bacterium]|jgi:hypothetical protein